MTTKVTVDAHAGWPVKVEAWDKNAESEGFSVSELGIVAPGQALDFHVHSTRRLLVTEMESTKL